MKVLGITGGIGSGKSTMLSYIKNTYKVRVIEADQVGHLLMEEGTSCYDQIIEHFGTQILNKDKTINRSLLGQIVFEHPSKLQKLNEIIHPQVRQYIQEEIEKERRKATSSFFVIEAALLIEDHYDEICDEIWYIYASEDVRRKRLIQQRNYTDEKIDSILKKQLTEEEFRKHCDFIIDNNNDKSQSAFMQIDKGLREHEFM
ncbi:MAG TPA: dephospho-CoA kinase [Candidatus Merdenecus merdavium]|nr:dephospho-CoA kinase [Candidatus Merdenecus merdavium]